MTPPLSFVRPPCRSAGRPTRTRDDRQARPAAFLGGALVLLLAGCGAGAAAADAPSTLADQCRPIDVTRIRADAAKRVAVAKLPAADRDAGLVKGRDSRSFVARVTTADLADAGMGDAAGGLPAGGSALLFVNHGTWTLDDFAYSMGLGNGEPAPPPEPIAWTLIVQPPGGGAGWARLTTAAACVQD